MNRYINFHRGSVVVVFLLVLGLMGISSPVSGQVDGGADFTLEDVMREALEANPDLLQQRETIRQAEHDLDRTSSQLWPQVEATGRVSEQKDHTDDEFAFRDTTDWQAGVNVSQALYRAGKLFAERTRASEQISMEEFRQQRNEEQILFEVASLYIQLLNTERLIEIAESSLERELRFLDQAEILLEVGEVTRTAVLQAEVQVAQAEQGLEEARNDREFLRDQLALEIGRDTLQGEPAELEDLEPAEEDPKPLIERAMEQRRDLRVFQNQIAAAQAGVDSEEADFWPTVDLTGDYTWQEESERFPDGEDWMVAVNASLPLYDAGLRRAELQTAQSQLSQAEVELQRQERIVRSEVRDAQRRIETQGAVLESVERQQAAAMENYNQVIRQFEEGLVSSLDVVEASTTLVESENRLVNTRSQLEVDFLNLELATGEFFNERVQPLRMGE